MENQHRKIKGYRDLNEQEINLVNEIKEKGVEIQKLLLEVEKFINLPHDREDGEYLERINIAEPWRWLDIAKTHFQQANMAAIRAVTQPTFF